ncbi:MAG: DUF4115 domain-containing protein [Terriglobales bacterium]
MSRLRVRIELNRGGVGVPLEKLASVVQQAQSFFRMLADDVHIDQSQGDWLGFDFDHESLNFTAEFVGPVTQEQVAAFHSAFDGTTPLRRATIAQFARIADAIEEDEVIGFGLYLNESDDPGEWRCLSRRDALRIAEEIQVLLGAGQVGQESHLPAAGEVSTSARHMFGRRDRSMDAAKLTGAVREVEANLSKRISRLEGEVADHSSHIHDLRSKSFEAEQSMGRLLSAVEGFCEQAANRLETVTPPGLSAAAAAGMGRAPIESRSLPEGARPEAPPMAEAPPAPKPHAAPKPDALPKGAPVLKEAAKPAAEPMTPAASVLTAASASPLRAAAPVMTAAPFKERAPAIWWRSPIVILVGVSTVVILVGILLWPTGSSSGGSNQETSASEPVHNAPVSTPPPTPAPNPVPAAAVSKPPASTAPAVAGTTHVELVASEPSWVAIRASDGTTLMSGLIEPGKSQSVDIRQTAVLRAGNAGGLTIRANGKSLGPLGPHGAVRDVEFKNGDFKLIPVQ